MASQAAKTILLAGNPNVGKTTLFNALTGANAKVTNYPGVTVDIRQGKISSGDVDYSVIDIPGTYSLVGRSAEEQIAVAAIAGISLDGSAASPPDLVVLCIDASQAARCCYLLLQVQELGVPCVVALTMADEAKAATPDVAAFAQAIGCPVIAVNAPKGEGLDQLRQAMFAAVETKQPAKLQWQPSQDLQRHIDLVRKADTAWCSTDAIALWALQSIDEEDELVGIPPAVRTAVNANKLTQQLDDEPIIARWRWLDTTIATLAKAKPDRSKTERVDRILLHRWLGFAVFAAVMTVIFLSLFAWSAPLMDAIEGGFKSLGGVVRDAIGEGILGDFVVDGVIGGVGTVMVFLPQIILLFLFLGILEDVGYLARVAYLMDRIMRAMNLHGRAFVPMLSGFACAVPAIMSTRTLERKRDRLLTMMVIPLMSCSARLPVYSLVIAAMMPGSALTQGLLLAGLYAFSVFTALLAAFVMSKTIKPLRSRRLPFFVELPLYRSPRWGQLLRGLVNRVFSFLQQAGTVILVSSIILWGLLYFPRNLPASAPDYPSLIEKATDPEAKTALESDYKAARLANSYGGRAGKAIEPVVEPLGFDWKISVGIVGSLAAREVFVATMGITFGIDTEADDGVGTLEKAISAEKSADGKKRYSPLVGLSLLLFFALACQCMSTLAVIKRESQSWRWPLFVFVYMTALAYLVSLATFQFGKLLGFG